MNLPSSQAHLSAAEQSIRDAVATLQQNRNILASGAAAFGLVDNAIRELTEAREALTYEIDVETGRMLAADPTRCAVQWGVCPEHGNTLASFGGRTWCTSSGCGQTWPGSRLMSHCAEPAVAIVADAAGRETRLCAGHWIDARIRLVGARLVRALPDVGPDLSGGLDR